MSLTITKSLDKQFMIIIPWDKCFYLSERIWSNLNHGFSLQSNQSKMLSAQSLRD